MSKKIIFLNIGWMKDYRGLEDGDEILGGGNYVNQNGFGHEIFNFQPVDGEMYGFVEPKTTSASAGRNSLHIEKIEKSYLNKNLIDGVLVVWTASRPNAKGNFIVGWYKNATIYRNEQFNIKREFRGEKFGYFITADEKDCVLLPEDFRTKEIHRATSKGEGWMGQSNIWYANHPNVAYFRQEVFDYINKNSSSINNIRNKLQSDPEAKKRIETVPIDHSKIDLGIKKTIKELNKTEKRVCEGKEINKEKIEKIQHKKDVFGNKILYEMCKNEPLHNDDDIIWGKVWLIGRSYAVAIERVREKKFINDDFYEVEVPKIFKKHYEGNFDRDVESMRGDEMEKILLIHKKFTDAIKKATGLDKRSFSSKYLHFHRPEIFYIYDSRASRSIHKIIKEDVKLFEEFKNRRKELKGKCDTNYAEFFIKCLVLKKYIKNKFNEKLSPRHIDDLLIYISNKDLRLKNN